jgi:hypothetical protein
MPSITKRDFDKAVSQPWAMRTCLIAQTQIRLTGDADGMYDYNDKFKSR